MELFHAAAQRSDRLFEGTASGGHNHRPISERALVGLIVLRVEHIVVARIVSFVLIVIGAEVIGPIAAPAGVAAHPAVDLVVAAVAVEVVVSGAAEQIIAAVATVHGVIAIAAVAT